MFNDISAALPTFFVTLREGFEATLVVGIVFACLQKAQQKQLYPWVYGGVVAGVVASVVVAIVLGAILQGLATSTSSYAPIIKQFLEMGLGLFAIAMLSWMLIWMTQQAKSLKSEVEGGVSAALQQNHQAGWGILGLIFIAVLREGFETVLFIIAKFQTDWTTATLGAVSGLTLATLLGVLLFKLGIKINIRLFFQVMGVFLLLIVSGLLLSVLQHLDTGVTLWSQLNPNYSLCFNQGDSCLLGAQVWQASGFLPDKQFPGIILKALFGYRQTLYLLQVIAYLLFLTLVGGLYFQSLKGESVIVKKQKISEISN